VMNFVCLKSMLALSLSICYEKCVCVCVALKEGSPKSRNEVYICSLGYEGLTQRKILAHYIGHDSH
jgi:hypothetical protein